MRASTEASTTKPSERRPPGAGRIDRKSISVCSAVVRSRCKAFIAISEGSRMLAIVLDFSAARLESLDTRHGAA
jgi:hypothetical protein